MPGKKLTEVLNIVKTAIPVLVFLGGGLSWYVEYKVQQGVKEVTSAMIADEIEFEIETRLKNKIGIEIKKAISDKEGSLSNKLAKGLEIDRESVDDVLIELARDYINTIDVGIKVNKKTEHLTYIHTNGHKYTPIYWDSKRAYYFRKPSNEWEMCH